MPTAKNTLSIYSFRANSRKNRTELLKNADFYLRFFVYRKPRHSGGVQKRLTDEQEKKLRLC